MDRRAARLIDGGEVRLDDMGDDIARMDANADAQPRIVQQLDAANQFNRRVTGHDGVIIVCVRRAKQRDQAVATFLAHDATVAANRRAHGNQRRLQPGDRLFWIEP
jgi:hypothetical protein